MAPRDEPGGCLSIGQAVSGMEVARAWSGLLRGTCEPVAPRPRAACGAIRPPAALGSEIPKRLKPRGAE